MPRFLKISPECVTESWKYSSKIHCQIDLLLVWSTHNSFHQLQHFFIAPFTLPSHRSFFHSFPFFFHMELMMVLCWFDNNIISLFIYDENSTVLCVSSKSIFFAAHHWCHTCVWVLVISMTRYSTRLKNWICSLKCTWHAGFFLCEIVTLIFSQLSRYWTHSSELENEIQSRHFSCLDSRFWEIYKWCWCIRNWTFSVKYFIESCKSFLLPFPFRSLIPIAHRHKFPNAVPCDRIELIKR